MINVGVKAELTFEQVDACFEGAASQSEWLIALYKEVVPDWDDVKELKGFPCCSDEMWKYVCEKAIAFDKQHHPGVFAGGVWINSGFGSDAAVGRFEIALPEIEYK